MVVDDIKSLSAGQTARFSDYVYVQKDASNPYTFIVEYYIKGEEDWELINYARKRFSSAEAALNSMYNYVVKTGVKHTKG